MKKYLKKGILALTLIMGMTFMAPQDAFARPRGYRTQTMSLGDGSVLIVVLYYEKNSDVPRIEKMYIVKSDD